VCCLGFYTLTSRKPPASKEEVNPDEHIGLSGAIHNIQGITRGFSCQIDKSIYQQADLRAAALFYSDQKRRCEEERRVRASDDADQEREREVLCRSGADEEEDEKREDDGERSVDRADKGLIERTARGDRKIFFAILLLIDAQILAHAVENDDRVVDREAENGKNGCHK
jgi:hypothetical protein